MEKVRQASHAGSWYTDNREFSSFLAFLLFRTEKPVVYLCFLVSLSKSQSFRLLISLSNCPLVLVSLSLNLLEYVLCFFLNEATKLSSDLGEWLTATGLTKSPHVRGVIAP